ncbi:MAG: hypothetical protein JWP97_3853 [Labilithrix sp.]|nr:hypothetical protein [Labilithrix sp.]
MQNEENGERRKDVRARISLPIAVLRRGGSDAVEMLDASFRGLFIRTDEPPPERQLVKLCVTLPTREIVLHAVVVRLVVDALGRTGVGLRFFAFNGQDRIDWESFISAVINRRAGMTSARVA